MKASTIWSHTSLTLSFIFLIFLSCLIFFSCAKDEVDGPPTPVAASYEFPPEVLDSIFTPDRPKEIWNVEEFLNRIVQKGMVIHEGTNPPELYYAKGANLEGIKYTIENTGIFDERNANADSIYGKYEETIRIFKDQQNRMVVRASYSSVGDPKFPQFPTGLDRGSGTGFASGTGNKFTIFYKVENGLYDNIHYEAIWIISGTVSNPPNIQEIQNVTKCMVMLKKGDDPEDKVANPGTIRIFKAPPVIQPEVVIDALDPVTGLAGTAVTISGTGFSGITSGNTVMFGTVPATVQTASATQLTVTAPAGPPEGGIVSVSVQVKNKRSTGKDFTYQPQPVVLTALNPSSGVAGTPVTITGSGFGATPTENTVMFGTTQATVQTATATQLTVTAPEGPTNGGVVPVTVQVGTRTSLPMNFTYLPPLTITTLNPTSGVAGTVVTITGTGFSTTAAENIVRFGTTQATVQTATADQLTVTAPALPTGAASGAVQVGVQVGTRTSNTLTFTYLPPVVLTALSPTTGVAGTVVTITGSGFSTTATENIVRFGTTQATVQTATANQLTVAAPEGSGTVQVGVQVGTRTSNTLPFGYLPPVVLTTLNPASAVAGTVVTITGTGFSTTAAENIVRFGTTQATVQTATADQLTVTAPALPTGAASGAVQVGVQVGTRTSNTLTFTYLPPVVLTTLNPTTGVAGTVVTITGSGFSTTASENIVRFGTTQATVQTATANQLTVTAPEGSGTVQVGVQVGTRTSNTLPFGYLPPVTITALDPAIAPDGVYISIFGSGFSATATGNTVMFGTEKAEVRFATTTQLTVLVPVQPLGSNDVLVTVQVGNRSSNPVNFTYPKQSGIQINDYGPSGGTPGTTVMLYGDGFSDTISGNTVWFGTFRAQVLRVQVLPSISVLTITAPERPQGGGPVPVRVQVGTLISNSIPFTYQ